jgi:hypothetical protein
MQSNVDQRLPEAESALGCRAKRPCCSSIRMSPRRNIRVNTQSRYADLETDSECPDVLELEWRLLADDLALVPWLAMDGVSYGSHDGLPSS